MSLARILAAAALANAPVALHATSIVDGSFETAGAGVTDYCYSAFPAGGNATCAPGNWGTAGGVIKSGSVA